MFLNCFIRWLILFELYWISDVFRECGGARCAHTMIPHKQCRHQTLNIVQQLVPSPGGDDDMGTLLGLMHSSPVLSLQLKTHILKVTLKKRYPTMYRIKARKNIEDFIWIRFSIKKKNYSKSKKYIHVFCIYFPLILSKKALILMFTCISFLIIS